MSLKRCLPGLVKDGALTQEQADRLQGLYDEFEADNLSKMGPAAAEAMASDQALKRFEAEAAQRKRQALLQVAAQQRILTDLDSYGGKDRGSAAVALFDHDGKAPYSNVEGRRRAIEGQAHAMMEGVLSTFSRDIRGRVRNRTTLHDVVREAFGEDTGNLAAKELSEAWGQAAEMLRTRFNAAGGGIGKLERWGLPQTHNMLAVRQAGFDEWRGFIAPLLDREKMLDPETGVKLTPQQLEGALRNVFENVRSDGWASRKPGGAGAGKKLANRHADRRFLVFKDADSWMAYSQRFGRPRSGMAQAIDPDGPIFDAMMGHISMMSRDIALAEILGPNPAATVRWIKDTLQHEEAVSDAPDTKGLDRAVKGSARVQALYDEIAGRNQAPENSGVALFFSGYRSLQVAAKLGSATLSAVTDLAFGFVTRRFNGLPVTKELNGYLKLLKPGSRGDRETAVRLGLIAEEASKLAVAQSRYLSEKLTGEMSARLAEGVLRLSGLSAWTQAGRWAFGMEFLSHITGERGRSWGQINAGFRRTLERYGFSEADWDTIRATPLEDMNGTGWIRPQNISDPRLGDRLQEMVLTETDFAVPVASVRTRAMFAPYVRPGTLLGEIVKSALLFKSFGVSMLLTHGRRMIEQQGYNKLLYGAEMAIATTLMGALRLQLGSIFTGKDPQPMGDEETGTDPEFWAQAMAQGGGFGIMGDFVKSSTSRYDDDLATTILGPVYGDGVAALKLGKQLTSDDGKPVPSARRFIMGILPGSSLWYAKLAFSRAMADQMQMQVDPDYYDSFARMERRARETGQDYWWRPGEIAPDRAPDWANIGKAAPEK